MRDAEIRRTLLDTLMQRFSGAHIKSEMRLCLGATRVDVAVINGALHGYEIKSDRDTLARLSSQVEMYDRVLDFRTIVCGKKYLDRVDDVVPPSWGIVEVVAAQHAPVLVGHRRPRQNKAVDPLSLAQLLWRDEAAYLLRQRGEQVRVRDTRWHLWDRLATMPVKDLRDCVREQLKARLSAQVAR